MTDENNQPDPNAWRTALAGDNADRAKLLEGFETPDKLFERISRPPIDDWRKAMAGDDPDELKRLERFADPASARKSWREAEKRLSEGGRIKIPGEGASDEELTEWRKALGVAESPDKYEIKVQPPAGYEVTDSDKGVLSRLQTKLHDAVSKGAKAPDLMNIATEFYFEEAVSAGNAAEEAAADAAADAEAELREAWGSKFDENVNWAVAGLRQYFPGDGDGEFQKFLGLRLSSGHKLGDHPVLLRMFANIGREHAEDPFFMKMKDGNKGYDPETRKREIMSLRETDPKQYEKLSAPGGELDQINAGLARRAERAA